MIINQVANNKRKIVFKVPEFPHVSETFIVAQIVTAINLGYDAQILVRKISDADINNCSSLIEQYGLLEKIIIEDYKIPSNKFYRALKWIYLLLINLKYVNFIVKYHRMHPKFSLTWLYQWIFYQKFKNFSIIHIQYGTFKYPIDLLKKTGYFKPALVCSFHGHDAIFPLYGYIENNGYYHNLFNYADVITANTPYLRDILFDLGCPKDKLEIVPVGVNTKYFNQNESIEINDKNFELITVGRLNVVKGQIYALKVIKRLKEAGYKIKFKLIGDGPEKEVLHNYIVQNNLEDIVCMLGAQPPKKVVSLLRASHLFLFTSVSEYQGKSTETQGLATLEAMACGLPVIGFNSGGIKYTFENNVSGFLCEEYDVDCVFDKVKYLIENQKILVEMGEEAKKFVNQNYSQDIIDFKWKNIYDKISDL